MAKKRLPRKKLTDLIEKYKKKLKISDIGINVVIAEDDIYKVKKKAIRVNSDCYAEILQENDEYVIIFFKKAFEDDLADTVLHELLHVVLFEYRQTVEELIEYTIFDVAGKDALFNKFTDREHIVIDRLIKILK